MYVRNLRPVIITHMFRVLRSEVFCDEQLRQHWIRCEVPPKRCEFERLCEPLRDEIVRIRRKNLLLEFSVVVVARL